MYEINWFASWGWLIASIDTIDYWRKYPWEYWDGVFYLMPSALFNDKKWNLIYKWDLLKYKWNNLVWEVDMIKWCWSIIHWTTIYKLFEYWLEYEIIWNIYQNKNLIWTVW